MVSAGATFVVSGTNGAICEPVPQPASAAVMRSSEAWRRRPPSPPRVLWVRRPRHAVDLALRDRPEIMLVLNVRPGIRIVLLDPVQKELLAGATQVHPPVVLTRELTSPLIHHEIESHLAGVHHDRRIGLVAYRALRRAGAGGTYPQHVDHVGRHLGLVQADRRFGCDQVGLTQSHDGKVLAAVLRGEAGDSTVVLPFLE